MIMNLGADLARAECPLARVGERYGERTRRSSSCKPTSRSCAAAFNARGPDRRQPGVNKAANQARLESLRVALDAQRSKVLRLKGLREEAGVLQRDSTTPSAATTRASRSAARARSRASDADQCLGDQEPRVAGEALFAGLKLNLGRGPAARACGMATAVFREHRDWRLRTEADVVDALKQPLLGVLPERRRQPARDSPSRQALAARVLGMKRLSRGLS